MRTPLVLISTFALLGCSNSGFNRPGWLKAPRVLAIQAEPPQPAFGTATALRALIYQPPAASDAAECAGLASGPTYQWSWCPFPTSAANNYLCPVDQAQLNQMYAGLGWGTAPLLDLGAGESATLINPFPAPVLRELCKGTLGIFSNAFGKGVIPDRPDGGGGSIFSCDLSLGDDPKTPETSHPLGFPVTITLVYTPPCGSPPQDKFGDTLTTVFTVHLPTDESVPPNQNPTVGEVLFTSGVDTDGGLPGLPSAPDPGAAASDDGGMPAEDAGNSVDGGDPVDGSGEFLDGGAAIADAAQAPFVGASRPTGSALLSGSPLPRQKRVGLWLELPLASSEALPFPGRTDTIDVLDQQGNTTTSIYHFERLNVAWFAEAGDFGTHSTGGQRTKYEPPKDQTERPLTEDKNMDDNARDNLWTLPKTEDYAQSSARLIVVVRDSRGGVAWTTTTATLKDEEKQP